MRRIINGKTYNTETATEIARWSNGRGYNDFYWVEERLMRTPKGALFIYGRGGGASCYAQPVGANMYSVGSELRAVTEEEALDWASEHNPQILDESFYPPEA